MIIIWLLLFWFADMRKPYNGINEQFDVKDLISKEPFRNFQHWLEQACNCSSVYEPNAMSIATATALVLLLLPENKF